MEHLKKEFHEFVQGEIKRIKDLHATCKTDKNIRLARDLVKKYPFLGAKAGYPSLDEILTWESTKERFPYDKDIMPLITHFISKIRGLFKHGQTEKTGLCNMRILSNIKNGILTIAIAKNTLDAKQQWEERLIKSLKEMLPPGTSLKDIILVISSKKNDLQGNATHCKSVNDAFAHFTSGNFKIIFVCSNNVRIEDILTLLKLYNGLTIEKRAPIDVQQDEAHNLEEGVPSKREAIEHIIMSPYVESYVPVTASYEPLIVESSVLWKRGNIDGNSIDYTKNSDTVSTSADYSSISDAHQLAFEAMEAHPEYVDHGVFEFDELTFQEADCKDYTGWSEEEKKADQGRRRKLEFCQYMKLERRACNLGMNILDNYHHVFYIEGDTVIETPIILPGVLNIHIITTPLRVAVTIHLMKYAIQQSYNPICIGLYRSGIHFLYKNRMGQTIRKKHSDLIEECSSEELNNKIFEILEHIKAAGESIERPVLIMGNYKPTGESITFVNFKYGTIRSDTLLPIAGLTKEKSYQGFLRSCYKDTKFLENNPAFVHPPKWIIGSQSSINDAMLYEKQNDERISRLKGTPTGTPLTPVVAPSYSAASDVTCAIPMKLTVLDPEDAQLIELRKILSKGRRTDPDKRYILDLLQKMIDGGVIDCQDPSGKFNFRAYTLKECRTWKQHSAEENAKRIIERGSPFESDYRFREYDSKHRNKMPYINNKGKIAALECELLVAYHKYEYDGFVNHKSCMWLSYRTE